jgi:hypothetical protein
MRNDPEKTGRLNLLERHSKFWRCETVDRTLIGVCREGAFFLKPFLELGVSDGPLTHQAVPEPRSFIPADYEKNLAGDPLDGDLFWAAKPPRAIPWLEAIIGCDVNVSSGSKAITARPPAQLPDLATIDLATNPWLNLMNDFTNTLAGHFGQRCPVGQTLMRGPSDMMAALLGQDFYTGLIDHPEKMKILASQCTEIWLQVLQSQYEYIPRYQGGYVSGTSGLWAPGRLAVYQEDAGGTISAAMYRKFFFECDAAIAAAFDYSLLHLHSASLHILGAVLEIPRLNAVNVVLDPSGPNLDTLIPDLRRIQKAGKALHLHGDLSEQEIELVKENLSPDGLCIWIVKEESYGIIH